MLWLPLSCIYCALMSLAIGTGGWSDSDSLVSKWHNLMVLLHLKILLWNTSEFMNVFFQTLNFVGSLKIFCRSKDGILGSLNPGFAQIGRYFFSFLGILGSLRSWECYFKIFFSSVLVIGVLLFEVLGLYVWGLCWYNIFCVPNFKSPFVATGTVWFRECAFFEIRRRFGSERGDSLEEKPISLHVWKDLNSRGNDPILMSRFSQAPPRLLSHLG